ncbi:hypothetical protein Gogos_001415 [Gossypium gossypioides]|uniref:Uncharacterized protein n=1 Tax=Gossypium gossypioides TaxID=34282 RepID=A0A7J9CW79_GOSGO|nr:hypothetical protein [Gossypium gossypioides]
MGNLLPFGCATTWAFFLLRIIVIG